jgi:hypothetical protein
MANKTVADIIFKVFRNSHFFLSQDVEDFLQTEVFQMSK